MEFDKSKVYTALNADDIKVGSKGYFADTISQLKKLVEQHYEGYGEIDEIFPDSSDCRFRNKDDTIYSFFYLVEEPEEKKFRPYKDTDEMIKDFVERYSLYNGFDGNKNPMYNPLIWVQNACGKKRLVTNTDDDSVYLQKWVSLPEFAEAYTYLDGSPCGIEEYL